MCAVLLLDGQSPHALAFGGRDRIRHSRDDRWDARLADSSRWIGARNDVDLDPGRVVDSQHLIVVKVALLNTPFVDCYTAVQGGGGSKDDGTLHLRFDRLGVDHLAAIYGANHSLQPYRSILAQ